MIVYVSVILKLLWEVKISLLGDNQCLYNKFKHFNKSRKVKTPIFECKWPKNEVNEVINLFHVAESVPGFSHPEKKITIYILKCVVYLYKC